MAKITYSWVSGGGPLVIGDINPRGWANIDFGRPINTTCCGYESACRCNSCLAIFQLDRRPFLSKLRLRHDIELQRCKRSSSTNLPRQSHAPLCTFVPVTDLPSRVLHLSDQFDTLTSQIANLSGQVWLAAFTAGLAEELGDNGEWAGRTIWAAACREDFVAFSKLWAPIGAGVAKYMPAPTYPSSKRAGHRAPFVDVGLGGSLGFFWVLNLNWDVQISGAFATAIAIWSDMKSGLDAPEGQLTKIFDVLPSLAQSCATGAQDNLAPMKALAMEYLRLTDVTSSVGPPPSVQDIWLSRIADVGAQEACVLMTGCNSAYSARRSAIDTRCLAAWGVIHDFFDMPRDLVSTTKINAALWATFAGYSGQEVLKWLRDTVAMAVERESCAANLLLCTAFVHVTNPRWAVNGLAIQNITAWPRPPCAFKQYKEPLPNFVKHDNSNGVASDGHAVNGKTSDVCQCKSTNQTQALRAAALEALNGTAQGFANPVDRLSAHDAGLSALLNQDWEALINLSRTAWKSFWDDVDVLAGWLDSGKV